MERFVALAMLMVLAPSQFIRAEGTQDKPVRQRSEVDAIGRRVVERYADEPSAQNGILDVTKAPYLADPTGRKDSTKAIEQAMKDARDARLVTYLPSGTYRVSETISCIQGAVTQDHWPFGKSPVLTPTTSGESGFRFVSDYYPCVLMGSRRGQRSTIVLVPRSAGFGDPQRPKPLIHI